MNITLLTYGSQGDVEPFLVLGKGLAEAGHQVRLAAPGLFESLARDSEIDYYSLPGDPRQMVQQLVEQAGNNWWRMVSSMTGFVFPLAREVSLLAREATRDADLVVHSFLMTSTGFEIAREADIPDISLQTFPVFAGTKDFPAPIAPDLPLGGLYRRLSHEFVTQTFRQGSRILYKQIRKRHPEMPPLTGWPFSYKNPRRTPILFAFSKHVVPRPADWPETVHQTGYLFPPAPAGWSPDPALLDFLGADPSPIAVSFGSTDPGGVGQLIKKVRDAVLACGQRAVITGAEGLKVDPHPAIYQAGYLPYDWLFERCAAVIHHGGAGTTGKALQAGKPSIVLPFTSDQPFWGRQVYKMGAGPKPLKPGRATVGELANLIGLASHDQGLIARAQMIGSLLREENGVKAAVDLILGTRSGERG